MLLVYELSRTASKWHAHGVSGAARHCSVPAALYSLKEGCEASPHPPSTVYPQAWARGPSKVGKSLVRHACSSLTNQRLALP